MTKHVQRPNLHRAIRETLRDYPVVLLLGPRQCGKTTIAKEIADKEHANYFDLEDPECVIRPESASFTLRELKGLVVLDEFQRQPSLFNLLRVLADRRPLPARFLILGSASPDLIKGASESLAGRVGHVFMGGFSMSEAGTEDWLRLWTRGRFPSSFLASGDERSYRWRLNFIHSFLERDIPQFGLRTPGAALYRFWTMLAHLNGQVWNASDLARALDAKHETARRYLDILCGSFMIRQLPPWFENMGKRVVKSPKVYLRDTGILHALLGLRNSAQVRAHPRLGFSWEGFALEEILTCLDAEREAYFYKTHAGAELDLVIHRGGMKYGFEFKYRDAPRIERAMRIVANDLKLKRLFVVYPGRNSYQLAERIYVLPLSAVGPHLLR